MRRLHMPEALIDLFVGMVEGQRVSVKTAVGMTKDFMVPGGLPQGDPCSPLLWILTMDPIICALREMGERGWAEARPAGYSVTWKEHRETMWAEGAVEWVKKAGVDERRLTRSVDGRKRQERHLQQQ